MSFLGFTLSLVATKMCEPHGRIHQQPLDSTDALVHDVVRGGCCHHGRHQLAVRVVSEVLFLQGTRHAEKHDVGIASEATQDEERARSFFVWLTFSAGVTAFLVALVSMALLK